MNSRPKLPSIARATAAALLTAALNAALPATAQDFTFSVDVPTRLGGVDYQANQTVRHNGPLGYSLEFDGSIHGLGGDVNIDALAKLPGGAFLFSTDAPFTVGPTTYRQSDIVRYDAGAYSLYLSLTALGASPAANVDAVAFDPTGSLLVSFDAPETVGLTTYQPNDIARAGAAGLSLFVDGQSVGIDSGVNVVGFELLGAGSYLFMFDAPAAFGPLTFSPGAIARRDVSPPAWTTFYSDPGFPAESAGTDFSLPCVGSSYGGVLSVKRTLGSTIPAWTAGGAGLFDLVRGDLLTLRASAGNFTFALNAIAPGADVCMGDNTQATTITDLRADPPSGGGYFYLVRAVAGCGQGGGYDDGTQAVGRDAGIAAAANACP